MSTEWTNIGDDLPRLYAPGEFEDHEGNRNTLHVMVSGYAAVEATPEEWRALGAELLRVFGDHRDPKRCTKCGGPIPSPMLGVRAELCPLCGDGPASMEELADLLRVAMAPLIVFRDRALDIEQMEEGDPLRDAARALDEAFDSLDSTLRWFEVIEGACRYCDDPGPHEGMCCEDCFDVLADSVNGWTRPLANQRLLVAFVRANGWSGPTSTTRPADA